MAAKNPNGDGSVYFEPPTKRANGLTTNGRWRASYRGADGRMKRLAAATRAEVEQRRATKIAELTQASPTPSQFNHTTTVGELVDWWLDSIARHQVKASTFDSYRRFGRYFSEHLGALAVVDVRAETLIAWQAEQLDKFAPLTALNSRKVARQASGEAVKLGLIPANPFDLVRAPRAQRVNPGRALTPDAAKVIVLAAQQYRLGTTVTLLFCQGWRVSEVLGLAWEDLDLDAGTAQYPTRRHVQNYAITYRVKVRTMRIKFDDNNLRRLCEEPGFFVPALGSDVMKAFRKKVGFLVAANSELDLRNYRALHFEKLKGNRQGQHSIRLNKQWRLILRMDEDDAGQLIIVIEIVDYH